MIDFKGHRFERDIILLCVLWYLSYPLSHRNLAEMISISRMSAAGQFYSFAA